MISWKTMSEDDNISTTKDLQSQVKQAYDLPFSTNWRFVEIPIIFSLRRR